MLKLFSALAFASGTHADDHLSLLQMQAHSEEEIFGAHEFNEEDDAKMLRPPGQPKLGTKGTNDCPAGFVKVKSDETCQKLGRSLGYTYTVPPMAPKFETVRPGGCYVNKKKKLFFNPSKGAAFKKATPVCIKPAAPRPGKVARPDKKKKPRNVCTVLKCKKKGSECCFVPLMQRGKKVYGRRGEWPNPNPVEQQKCLKKKGQWCDAQQNIHGPRMPPQPERKRTVCTALKCRKKGNECCFLKLMQKGRQVYGRRGEWPPQDPKAKKNQEHCINKGGQWCDKDMNEHKKNKVVPNPKAGKGRKPGKVARRPRRR